MRGGDLNWPRLAVLAMTVLALHALLLRGMHDARMALDRAVPSPRLAAIEVRTLRPVEAVSVEPAAVAAPVVIAAPTGLHPPPAARAVIVAKPALQAPQVAVEPAAATAPSAGGDLPIYRTRIPPPFAFGYALQRGALSGSGELHWQARDGQYEARLTATNDGAPWLVWDSVGAIDAAGLAPLRYTDRRPGRGAQAANFRRELGKVTFSGPAIEHALPPGAQDRLSWMLQLAAIAAADPSLVGPNGRVSLLVVGARGDADVWTFVHAGEETLDLPPGSVATVRLLREPQRAWDTRAEVWLDPARHYLPVRARLSNGADENGLQFVLSAVLVAP